MKNSALQETAFYRAKVAAYESGSLNDVTKLERERSTTLERRLAAALAEQQNQARRLAELTESLATQAQLREQAEERIAHATKRAEHAEAAHAILIHSHTELQDKHSRAESTLREHSTQITSLTSVVQQRDADHSHAQSQLESLYSSRDQHIKALEHLQSALAISTSRAEEADALWRQSRDRIAQLEVDQIELRNEVELRVHEVESASARLAETENAWAKSRVEADAFRALTTGSLGQLLDSHKDLKADEERSSQGHVEKVAALEEEVAGLRLLLKEFEDRASATHTDLADHRQRLRDLAAEHVSLKSQMSGIRAQLSEALASSSQGRKEVAEREAQLKDSTRGLMEAELRLSTLRNYLAENGITPDLDELLSRPTDSDPAASSVRVRELELQLAEKTRLYEDAERAFRAAERQRQTADAKLEQLSGAGSPRSGSPMAQALARADAAERQLAEVEQSHKDRLQQMEADYQTAVHYVK
jgi:chromosome segregation ATPase